MYAPSIFSQQAGKRCPTQFKGANATTVEMSTQVKAKQAQVVSLRERGHRLLETNGNNRFEAFSTADAVGVVAAVAWQARAGCSAANKRPRIQVCA